MLTEESWRQERFDTYLNISQDVQDLHALLRKAQSRIKDLKLENNSIDLSGMPEKIFAHNAAHYDDNHVKLKAVDSLHIAERVFEERKKQANEIYGMLWPDGTEVKLEKFSNIEVLEEARQLARKIVEQDLVAWERRMSDVASVASMLTA